MFYIFHGDDQHAQREQLAELQRTLGDPAMLDLNTSRFQGHGLHLAELQHACDSIPFLADKRLVIVSNLLSGNPPFLDDLVRYLPNLPETARLFFLESKSLPKSHPVIKLAEQSDHGFVKAFSRKQGQELEQWVRQRVKKVGGTISPAAVHLLTANAGNDLALLDNEIEKLVLYKSPGTIEPADVQLLCPYIAEANIFDLVDAVGNRQGRQSARLLHEKLAEGNEPFQLFAMIIRQFRLLIQVKELAEEGLRPPEISQTLNLHAFVAGKLFQQCQNYSMIQLEQIYAHLLETDVAAKTGQMDLVTSLDLLVAGLAN